MPAVPASVAAWAQGARLLDGLGDFHRPITTSAAAAQQYFDQGMRLAWAFNHDEAARSFAAAAQLDPACAACYWGVALTVGPNYNFPAMDAVRAQVAWEALHEAQQNAAHTSAVEQALIAALAARYPTLAPLGPHNLDAALAPMRPPCAKWPGVFRTISTCRRCARKPRWMCTRGSCGRPTAGRSRGRWRSRRGSSRCCERAPGHPGANHYYIHVMEASPHPEKARAAAARLPGMMPGAGHLEHMPAHIMQRLGRYEDAAEANRRGILADQAYLQASAPPELYAMYLAHNYSFLAYSAAMEGRKAETLAAVQGALAALPLEMQLAMGDIGLAARAAVCGAAALRTVGRDDRARGARSACAGPYGRLPLRPRRGARRARPSR